MFLIENTVTHGPMLKIVVKKMVLDNFFNINRQIRVIELFAVIKLTPTPNRFGSFFRIITAFGLKI